MFYTRDKILAAACLATGLEDYGADDFLEPLEILIADYHSSAKLNRKGIAGSWIYLHRMLCNRLRLNHYMKTTPADQQVIHQPVFILGLPRTGSTLLHELLASHPSLRAPAFWEASFVPGYSTLDRSLMNKTRQWLTSAQIGIMDLLAPKFRSVHSLGTHRPHECVTLQGLSLRTMQFHAAHNLQSYDQWLATCDWQPAYDYHERYLKWLQFGDLGQPRRWVLKAPGHLLSIAELVRQYPNARIVQLHRNPCEVIPSMASLFLHIRKPFTQEMDLTEIGRDVTNQWHRGLQQTMAFRQKHPELESMWMDVHYKELVANPLTTAEKILAFANVATEEKELALLQSYISSNPKNKHGSHQYSLEQFGLDEPSLSERFKNYNDQFNLAI